MLLQEQEEAGIKMNTELLDRIAHKQALMFSKLRSSVEPPAKSRDKEKEMLNKSCSSDDTRKGDVLKSKVNPIILSVTITT